MLFELKVALRFLKEGKSQTIFILAGIALGVSVQIFLSSLITGLQVDLINKTVGDSSHITVKPQESPETSNKSKGTILESKVSNSSLQEKKINNWSDLFDRISNSRQLKGIAPFADGSAFVTKGKKTLPVNVRGIVLDYSDKIYKVKTRMVSGTARIGGNDIILGKSLALQCRKKRFVVGLPGFEAHFGIVTRKLLGQIFRIKDIDNLNFH